MRTERRENPQVETAIYTATPASTPEQLLLATRSASVVIIITYASGTLPERLNPAIETMTKSGKPVFLLSNNKRDNHGIVRIAYVPQVSAAQSGAIALEKVNINNIEEVLAAIQEESQKGKSGQPLGEAIKQRFAYQKGEGRPKAEWETKEGQIEQKQITREALSRGNANPKEVDEVLKIWGGEDN